jgi:sugar/nucleoside kinase (ribokinase family)
VLCVIGDLLEDVVVHTAGRLADTDNDATVIRSRGGSAANVAAAAATAGGEVRFIGCVGADAAGLALTDDLAASGVDVRVQRTGRTGTVVVIVEDGGGRTMYPDRGAAAQLGPIDATWADGVTWVHVPAYSLCAEPIGASTRAFVERARGSGAGLSIDVSSVGLLLRYGSDLFASLLDALAPDVVLANAEEAAAAGGPRSGSTWVVKDGARPVVVAGRDGHVDTIEVPPVARVVDTTGAGDAFAAGFLVATLAGSTHADGARAGVALAARTLGVGGAGLG